MPQVTINNVDVDFPFVPYQCQEDYMGHVLKALQEKSNAILESPTGTGKTLCLLCSILAWRLTYIAKLQLNGISSKTTIDLLDQAAGDSVGLDTFSAAPKIIYASRTHSQITQVVSELKNTIYKPRMAVLGSRDQLCLHPKVMDIENKTAKIHACRLKVKERSCVHHRNVEKKIADPIFSEILDIEDLVKVTRDKTMCPYYSSRELLKSADIIFMPYNYLVDHQARKKQNINLKNAVIIFDEAHNIEKVCEESFSFEITSLDIANCIENCQLVLQRILDDDAESTSGYDDTELGKQDILTMKALFLSLEREFNKIEVKGNGSIIDISTFKALLTSINVTELTKGLINDVLRKMEEVLAMSTSSKIVGNTYTVLNSFMQILDLTIDQAESAKHQYVCYVSKERKKDVGNWKTKNWGSKLESASSTTYITKLSYWCFSPGLAMEEFVNQGVHSIILTSGTLSPLSSFSSELKIPFPITLQNPHVIKPEQISVQVLCRGCDGEELISTYANRTNPKYLMSLGNTIVNLLRVIPHGVLVFFPSYGVMNLCIQAWQEKGLYTRMMKIKSCFIEPKSKADMHEVMKEFDTRVREPTETTTGAMLFAVCRGKVSEGIDFSDMHGRAVIITGLPFPPKMDPKINAKINFLDQQKRRNRQGLNGNEWYIQQSSRAVNQAVGRVIRHKDDFGVVLLMDKRFSYKSNIAELPKWTREFVKVHEKFGSSVRELSQFFKFHAPREVEPVHEVTVEPEPDRGRLSSVYGNYVQTMLDRQRDGSGGGFDTDNHLKDITPPPKKKPKTDKRCSLLTSLSSAPSTDFAFPPSMSPVSTKSIADYFTPDQIRNPKKRIRVIPPSSKSKVLFSDLGELRVAEKENTSNEEPQSDTNNKPSKSSVVEEESRKYSLLLKSTLNEIEYLRFKKITTEYGKQNDVNRLIMNIKNLFSDKKELLLGFRVFLRSHHKEVFDKHVAQ